MKKAIRAKKKVKKSLQVKSHKSGLTHHIDDFDDFEKVAESILQKFKIDNQLQLAQSLKFQEAVASISLDTNFLKDFESIESYRICFNGLSPLSIAGSLACGGRFNIGGAQKIEQFPYEMTACIYAASNIDCAKAETGPHKNAEIYELVSLRPIKLWDVKALLSSLENSEGFVTAVEKSPFNMQWSLQKFPTPSQILGATLRKVGGDGILYPSTKHHDSIVYGFFIKDETEASVLLKATLIDDGQFGFPISKS
ncbi:MAG: RES family NAD+ phosphorylase [Bdellovibrio sp.]